MAEKRYEILTVVLETENYRDIGGAHQDWSRSRRPLH